MIKRLVFDSKLWKEAGYDQPDDNAQFWKPAAIVSVGVDNYGDSYATVVFDHDGRTSRGHFTRAMRDIDD